MEQMEIHYSTFDNGMFTQVMEGTLQIPFKGGDSPT
jgi:hypothetical protein